MFFHLHRRLVLALFGVAGLGMTPGQLFADQVGLSAQATAGASTGGQNNSQNFAVSLAPSTVNVPGQSATINFTNGQINTAAAGSAGGTVNFGSITGVVTAAGNESSSLEPPGLNLNNTGGSGEFIGTWQDSLLVTSTTLSQGTPVDLLLTMTLNGNLSCSGSGASAEAFANFSAGANAISYTNTACNSLLQGTQTLNVATTVGADLQVQGELNIVAAATGVNDFPSTAGVDPPSSAFFIDSLTPGASYTTGSGNTYFTPTVTAPEPSSWLLLGTGLLALLGLVRPKSNT
jgi:hypothetical protein